MLELSERQRRDIFVAPNPVVTQAPSGAASSEYPIAAAHARHSLPHCQPLGAFGGNNKNCVRFQLKITIAITRNFATFSNPLPAD
jgi:hypothetical protein